MNATPARTRLRTGMTLIEIMVVVAVLGLLAGVGIPALSGILDLQQRGAAKEIAQTYTMLVDEAALRNQTFRIAYDLDAGTWQVEMGDPNTLVFGSPEEREKVERELKDKMARYTEREIAEGVAAADLGDEASQQFENVDDPAFTTRNKLPPGSAFAFVYTPQYGIEGARPSVPLGEEAPEEAEEHSMAYTYVFPDGSAEHTVVRVVKIDEPEDGYTIEVEPLTGKVSLTTDVVEPGQSMAWLPVDGPSLP